MAGRGGGGDAGPGTGSCPALIRPISDSDFKCIEHRIPKEGGGVSPKFLAGGQINGWAISAQGYILCISIISFPFFHL